MRFYVLDRRPLLALGAAFAVAIPFTGCGDSDGDETSPASASSGSGTAQIVAQAKENVERLQTPPGSYRQPQTSGATPAKGKTVWFISVGNEAESAAEGAQAFVEGAEALGWTPKVYDGKFNPSNWLAGVRQAVQHKADAIAIFAFDCAPVKAGLEEAKRAGIPVIAMDAFDCDQSEKGGPKLFTHTVGYSEGTFADWQRVWGEAQADYTIAKTNGNAKILFLRETDLLATSVLADQYEKRISKCPDCEIVEKIDFVATDLGPPLQAKVQQALLKHPDTTVVYANYDGPVTSGVAAAVRASGLKPMVIGADGLLPNLDLIRQGEQAVALGYVSGWEEYAALEAMVSIFAGEKPRANSGMGVLLTDKDHNLSPKPGTPVKLPIDWKAAYEKAWGVR
jgi:ribose transport system substrate-binding protein